MSEYNQNDYVFESEDKDKILYILQSGTAGIYLEDADGTEFPIYKITEQGAILGIVENILNTNRLISIKAISEKTEFKTIDLSQKNIKNIIQANPQLGLQFSINLSKRFKKVNAQLATMSKILDTIKVVTNKYCLTYYEYVELIKKLNNQLKFPWLNAIYEKVKMNIIYTYGVSAKNGSDVLDELTVDRKNLLGEMQREELDSSSARVYKKGEVLCKEGEIGNEIFILNAGVLSVFINNNKVAEIKDKGAIIGEIAVLLGLASKKFEVRTATVKVKEEAKVIVLPANKILEIISKDPKIIIHINKTLAERLPESYNALANTYTKISKAMGLLNPNVTTSASAPKAFKLMLEVIEEKANDKSRLKEILDNIDNMIIETKNEYTKYETLYERIKNLF